MLVLARKEGERIWINDNICIVVVEVRGDKVRIGIEAPPGVPVWREEVLARMAAGEVQERALRGPTPPSERLLAQIAEVSPLLTTGTGGVS